MSMSHWAVASWQFGCQMELNQLRLDDDARAAVFAQHSNTAAAATSELTASATAAALHFVALGGHDVPDGAFDVKMAAALLFETDFDLEPGSVDDSIIAKVSKTHHISPRHIACYLLHPRF